MWLLFLKERSHKDFCCNKMKLKMGSVQVALDHFLKIM